MSTGAGASDPQTMNPVVLLGAAGATGGSALAELRDAGYRVRAHSRRAVSGHALPFRDDPHVVWSGGDIISDHGRLRRLLDGASAVVDMRVALPGSVRSLPTVRRYSRVRDAAFGRVVDACIALGVPRVVHDTVTMVYRDGGAAWLDETSPVSAPGMFGANLRGEAHSARFTEAGGVGVSLRLGIIHGDDPVTRLIEATARRGWFAIPGSPDAYVSTLALPDAGRAVRAALTAPAGLYNVAEEPRTRGDVSREYARRAGRTRLRTMPGLLGGPLGRSQRVSSAAFTAATGWTPTAERAGGNGTARAPGASD